MKLLLSLCTVLLASQANATNLYYQTLVPAALTNIGITTPFATGCITCHSGAVPAFANLNATLGAAIQTEATNQGITLAGDGVANISQAQMNTIISNIQNLDSDTDTISNRDEWIGGSNAGVFTSMGSGGGTTGGPCDTDPSLPQCTGGGGGQNSSSSEGGSGNLWSDQDYQLNSGCAAEETAMLKTRNIQTAGLGGPLGGIFALWLLPLLISLIWRNRSPKD